MTNKESIQKIKSEIEEGIRLTKCKRCGCMKETLENLLASLSSNESKDFSNLLQSVEAWLKEINPIKYACLGCEHCFPAAATNILITDFPSVNYSSPICEFEIKKDKWPPVAGEYFVFCEGPTCPVAVSTLGSIELAETLANKKPEGLCIIGKTETENIGIDKIIKNTITNSTIRFLVIAGKDPQGHYSGKSLLSLYDKGVDGNMRIIGSPGRHPVLKNVSLSEIKTFRKQVQVIDMIGCEDTKKIIARINELSRKTISTCECKECFDPTSPIQISTTPKIMASEPKKFKMDKAGYFVVIPLLEKQIIIVEHYAYDNKLLHIVEGKDTPSIYSAIIENGWISELSHAAYLGRELAKAELSLKHGFKYLQDKAPGDN